MKGVRIEGVSDIRELVVLGDWAYLRSHLQIAVTPPAGNTTQRTGYELILGIRAERRNDLPQQDLGNSDV
jgi:hypothetical protein